MRGSKRETKKGVWELRVSLGKDPATGRYLRLSRTIRGSARDADAVLREMLDQRAPGVEGAGATVGQLLDEWLAEGERLELSPTTLRTYRSQIEKTIRPRLGNVQIVRLTAKHLDDLYRDLKSDGKSPKTIRNYHAIIAAALHQAVRWGWVRSNVAEMAKAPRLRHRRVVAPSVEQVRKVIEMAEERDPRQAPLMMLAALTGMRRGELCALRWSDVDLDRGVLEVRRSLVVVPGGLEEKAPKTDRTRKIALDPVGVALLMHHRTRVRGWAAAARVEIAQDAFVFSPFVEARSPFRPDNVTSFFIRVRDAAGAKSVRLHDLRHFTATLMVENGADIRYVQEMLGHRDLNSTQVYTRVAPERLAAIHEATHPGAKLDNKDLSAADTAGLDDTDEQQVVEDHDD